MYYAFFFFSAFGAAAFGALAAGAGLTTAAAAGAAAAVTVFTLCGRVLPYDPIVIFPRFDLLSPFPI